MSSSSAPLGGTSHVPPFIAWLNPLIGRLLRAGLPFGPNVLLTVRGRSSGLPRTFPVAILALDDRRFVQSPFGEVQWVRNLRASGEAILTKGRERETVVATELAPEAAGPVLRAALASYLRSRFGGAYLGRTYHLRPDSAPEEYVVAAREHPVFELRRP